MAVSAYGQTAGTTDDPYLWLEDVHAARPLAWVKDQNAKADKVLKSDPSYQKDFDAILSFLDAADRIPMGTLHGDWVFNFWQDADHVRGIWRRTSIASYATQTPQWETLLDVDRLAADERRDWVFKRAQCTDALDKCLISLSPGGGDAVVVREFDMAAKSFPAGGFALPEGKTDVAYTDDNTVLLASDFGPGSLTQSGYARIVKYWTRGHKIADAKTIFEGKASDVAVAPRVFHGADETVPLIVRAVSFFETEYFYMGPNGRTEKLPLPLFADVQGAFEGQLIATLREDWTPEGGTTIKQGSLIAVPLKEFLVSGRMPPVAVLVTPDARGMIDGVAVGKDAVYAAMFENVVGSMHAFHRDGAGAWTDTRLDLPAGGSTHIVSANRFGPGATFTYEGFLTPTTLYAASDAAAPRPIKSLPPRFDAAPYDVAQYEAVSKDGTRIPYFFVRAKGTKGPAPTLLYGYGGFQISQTPFYWASAGRVWLPKGGAYAVANIRGGGEFGPAWHDAALKTHRQRAFDDFIAVAEDLEQRGLTTPRQLGIMGGSNGGLLVGTVAIERPDLFGAVVCQVPLLDMMRFTKIGAGASWVGEYGDPANPEERQVLLSYSPYQNVEPKVKYPPIFLVTATSDDRVTPVHARKMAAKMEAQGHDVLFYENTEGGHAAAANHKQQAEMNALAYTYLAQKLGLARSIPAPH